MSNSISATINHGITLAASAYSDPVTITGSIYANSGDAVFAPTSWSISNSGSIIASVGEGVFLKSGGFIENSGVIDASAAYGVWASNVPVTIENSGYVSGGRAGIMMVGDTIALDNLAGGTISGGATAVEGIKFSGGGLAANTLVNGGLIDSGDTAANGGMGVRLNQASMTNAVDGVVSGGSVGIYIGNDSRFVNFGTVAGETGIMVGAGQNLVTIVDAGTITGDGEAAISFAKGGSGNSLTLLPGAVLGGLANGGGAADLVFAGTSLGTLGNLEHEVSLFPTIALIGGAEWDFTGASSMTGQMVFNNDGTVVEGFGDALSVSSTVTGTGTIELAGGAVNFGNVVAAGQTIDFVSGESTLTFNESRLFSGTIDGFQNGDTIDVTGFGASQTVTGAANGNDFVLSDGAAPITIAFGSSADTLVSEIASTVDGRTYEIVAPCFRAGTRLLTPDGPRPVESLRKGDLVVTHDGSTKPVVWHGHRRIDCDRHPNPAAVLPVLIEAAAFGPGVPARDLYVSPDHAIYCDRVLVQAKYLINGVSIRQIDVSEVTYHHIELEVHDVVWAETLPAETYLDCGNRHHFARQKGPVALHPNFAPSRWDATRAFAPLAVSGTVLTAIRQRLHDRLREYGVRCVAGRFAVYADGRRLEAIDTDSGQKLFRLPATVGRLTIESSCSSPADLDPASFDRRRLGIAITDITLDGVLVSESDPRFSTGFYPSERRGRRWFRWTDGAAVFDASGVSEMAFTVQAVSPIWQIPDEWRQHSTTGQHVLELH
ncbi:Hint domain-containing protein [Acidiphilium sp.]|uniref:Hint domain-containing protein n=1 Tax=Acidiphilium sp. TaxID=527 RepID=UPI003D017F0B